MAFYCPTYKEWDFGLKTGQTFFKLFEKYISKNKNTADLKMNATLNLINS